MSALRYTKEYGISGIHSSTLRCRGVSETGCSQARILWKRRIIVKAITRRKPAQKIRKALDDNKGLWKIRQPLSFLKQHLEHFHHESTKNALPFPDFLLVPAP